MIGKSNRLLGAILLVSGTTVGAGMLGLPNVTGQAGFLPALLLMTFVWLFMMLTAYYFLEVNLRMKGETNLITMAHRTLGKPGEIVSWIVYLLLFYALVAAYMVGCSQIFSEILDPIVQTPLYPGIWPLAVFVVFGAMVYFGTQAVDWINRLFMLGLVVAYIVLVSLGVGHVKFDLLSFQHWPALPAAAAVAFTTFGYHIIIPTLTTYLDHDPRLLKRAIFVGSLIPFIIYIVWHLLVLGVVPVDGEESLSMAAQKGLQVTFYLKSILGTPLIGLAARLMALCAIVTSLLGVALSLTDFLADGLNVKKTPKGKIALILLTFVPPLLFALFYPRGFLLALKFGGIFVAILLALLPALMAWFERYNPREPRGLVKSKFKVFGGKALLVVTLALSLIILVVEVVA